MKGCKVKRLALTVFLLLGASSAFSYNGVCNLDDMLSMDQIREKLIAAGYSQIKSIQLDDCLYEAEARDKNGDHWDLQLNPKTGVVIGKERDNFYD